MLELCAWDRVARRLVYVPKPLHLLIPWIEQRGVAWLLRQRKWSFVEGLL